MANTWTGIEPPTGANLFKIIGIPECLHDLMEFAGVQFVFKGGRSIFFAGSEEMAKPTNWIITMPTNIPGKRVEIPINDPIDEKDPEGHWRAILAAAADFQALVNTGQYGAHLTSRDGGHIMSPQNADK